MRTSNPSTSDKPYLVKLDFKLSPIEFFCKIVEYFEYAYLLESVEGPEKLTEYSFLGFDPCIVVAVKDGLAEVQDRVKDCKNMYKTQDPLQLIRSLVGERREVPPLRFVGGAVGYISYDAIR